ncbi:putative amidase [Streptomyces ambofaciens ATCC 23877]|uniref:Putative amidase n=1 Tax=Streptomyces ambofaciens (strain ATCC 23877 / 3486 / DSM 40053 / JCM 4204 / NBRC 12836 / NRRL B-2516) TaxID=278992 RepID=Q1RQT8_STRA7|nr:amidase family protein [Streptomyces ambofaciens]AKZ53227.1 putative amidase [Streptomyces ambofaciens ATCC 23877]AKZ60536.1 putative amidase [Streptomyces ambofaciens ATCC 23877]CAI78077.1 putative amidase [Streptomyces ambofaciens ATCC 23877]CAI78351.1 putative amidase [Streptomyces ambofaciens ATCC 23877]CAJ87856.1 putative amidase [Streptomyces ambofaciens ATCC 23877]
MTARGIRRTKELLSRRELTAVEHVHQVLSAIRERDHLDAYVAVAGDEALKAAEHADALIRERGREAWWDLPLLGVTVSVKDLLQTRDLPTTRGSLLPNTRPAQDAPAVARLRAAGAIVVGKTSTSEFGWSASTVGRVAPPTRNPYDPRLTAGGSSGGAAAAVAAGLCEGALGTDGSGSIRIPAAFCGVVGYKPSYGRVPYYPNGADRLAHQGPLAASVADAALLGQVIAGPHPTDPDSGLGSLDSPRDVRSLRIGWIEYEGTDPEIRRVTDTARDILLDEGHHVDEVEVRCNNLYPAVVDILAANEAAGTSPQDEHLIDPGRLHVVRHGRTLSGVAVIQAEEIRQNLRATLRSVMDNYDLLAMATVPVEPFEADAIGPQWAADARDLLWLAWAPASYPYNMTGQPAASLPAGLTSAGLPAGVQLVGPVGADDLVLTVARRLEAMLAPLPHPPTDHLTPASTGTTGERTS